MVTSSWTNSLVGPHHLARPVPTPRISTDIFEEWIIWRPFVSSASPAPRSLPNGYFKPGRKDSVSVDDFDGDAAEEGAQEVAAGAACGVVGVGGTRCCVGRVGRPQFGEIECPSIAQSDWLCHCSRGGTDSLPPLRLPFSPPWAGFIAAIRRQDQRSRNGHKSRFPDCSLWHVGSSAVTLGFFRLS